MKDLLKQPEGYGADFVAVVLSVQPNPGEVPAVICQELTGTGATCWVSESTLLTLCELVCRLLLQQLTACAGKPRVPV